MTYISKEKTLLYIKNLILDLYKLLETKIHIKLYHRSQVFLRDGWMTEYL